MLCLSTHRNHHWRVKTSTLLLGQSNWFCSTDIFARDASSSGLFQYNLQIIELKKDTFLLCVRARIECSKNTVSVWQKSCLFLRKIDLSDWFKWSQMILISDRHICELWENFIVNRWYSMDDFMSMKSKHKHAVDAFNRIRTNWFKKTKVINSKSIWFDGNDSTATWRSACLFSEYCFSACEL